MTSIQSSPRAHLRPAETGPVVAPPRVVRSSNAAPTETMTNWNGVVSFRPLEVKRPSSVAELMEVVKNAERVRVAGSMHSMNGAFVADARTTLISTSRLNAISAPVTDADGTSVWIQPGAKLGDINAELSRRGLAIASLPTSEKITLAGAIANGVHGSGLKAPAVLAEQVLGLQLVTSAGELVDVPAADLPLARISLGSLGAIAGIKLRVVPAFNLVSQEDTVGREALQPDEIRGALSTHDHAMYIYDPNRDVVVRRFLTQLNPANQEWAHGLKRKTDYDENGALRQAFDHLALKAARFLGLTGPVGRFLATTHKAREPRVGASHLMFQENFNHPSFDMSYGVPLEKTAAAVADVKAAFERLGYSAHVPLAIRFLKGSDETQLGMNSGRDTAVIEFVSLVEFGENPAAQQAFEEVMRKHGGRPHWGKEFSASPRDAYPPEAWDRFAALSAQWGSKFVNEWAAAYTPAGQAPSSTSAAVEPARVDGFEHKPRSLW